MIKNSFEIYNRHLLKIMTISLVIVIPISLFLYFATFYVYDSLETNQYPNLYMLFFIIMNFVCIIPMYRKLAQSDVEDEEEPTIWELMKEFIKHFGMVLVISLPLYVIALFGAPLAFIPTAICGAIMLVFPFCVHNVDLKKVLAKTGGILKRENIFILFDLVVVVSSQILIYSVLMQAFVNFDNNFYVYSITRAIVNAAIFPFLIFYLTQRYIIDE
ncbi:hypothetical protein [Gracilibacillus salinarum]|uniref:Uncharacterized protein n=1 Tax=Gracilibacillus salinarum TaxID=2932255 RepID=A0ABY4GHD4_9BACI|nr:hypothetical protein [Gracilibacillus salinarum]UOQ83625.1 hypothetical protein MUN87_12755 [Gracilibacillus salinarum]